MFRGALGFEVKDHHVGGCGPRDNGRQHNHPNFSLLNSVGKRFFDSLCIVVSFVLMCFGIRLVYRSLYRWGSRFSAQGLLCGIVFAVLSIIILFHGLYALILGSDSVTS